MAIKYFAVRLSEHIARIPDTGFLLCRDVVIARTGYQRYSIGELDKKDAAEVGIDTSDPSKYVDLYRPSDEVFSPDTLASFEGKPFTDEHPPEFVNVENIREFACGHAQNIRRGHEPLDDGEFPLLADLIVTDAETIAKIGSGLRELSCGYRYKLKRDGNRIIQSQIRGNHIALVPKGRAGPEARIYDAAPKEIEHIPAKPELRQYTTKEKTTVKNWSKFITGLGLQKFASDPETQPEDFAEAAAAACRATDAEESEEAGKEKEKKEADSKRARDEAKEREDKERADKEARDKKARDEEETKRKAEEGRDAEEKEKPEKAEKDKAKDAEPSHYETCKVKDCMDRDCRMHRALDNILEQHPKEEGEDADMDELKALLNEFMSEEAKEPEHQDEASEVIEPIDPAAEMDAERKGKDGKGSDAKANDAEFEFLNLIRPFIAKSGNKGAIDAFNTRLGRFTRSSRESRGTYAATATASRTRANDAAFQSRAERNQHMTEEFRQIRTKTFQEVK